VEVKNANERAVQRIRELEADVEKTSKRALKAEDKLAMVSKTAHRTPATNDPSAGDRVESRTTIKMVDRTLIEATATRWIAPSSDLAIRRRHSSPELDSPKKEYLDSAKVDLSNKYG
jgi:hypothetical protein